jgi:hypothetical protein
LLAVIGVGCTLGPGLIPVTEFTKRHECQGFSVLPPKGENWFIGPSTMSTITAMSPEFGPPLCEFLFVKMLGRITRPEEAHTIFALASISQVNVGFQTSEEFLRFVERLIKENSLPRLRLLVSKAWLDDSLGSVCVRYERTVEDVGVPQFPGSVFFETDKGFFCIHPRASRFVVIVTYSQRFLKGQRPLSLEQEIEPVFKSLTFTSVEQMNRAQPSSPQGSYTPLQAEVVALAECQRMVFGEMDANKKIKLTYDILYGQWMIEGEKVDEMITCLVERHGWVGLRAPDGRRGARAPRPSAVAQHAEDELIVPGERIAGLRLAARLADIEAVHGNGQPVGQGQWDGSVVYSWTTPGLRAVVAGTSGNLLSLAISAVASSPWAGVATVEGLKFGSTEEEVRAAMGAPSRTIGDAKGKALHYRAQGIAFVVATEGAQAGRVTEVYVYWKHRTPGDAVVVPGHRISGVAVASTLPAVRALLGEGFFQVQQGDAEVFQWPHFAIAIILKQGHLWRVTGFYDEGHDELGLRYYMGRGVGIKSTSQELRAAFGEPLDRRKLGRVEEWVYPTIGLAAGIAMEGSLQGHVVYISVFAPQ